MKIYVVGIGPGNEEFMTPEARIAIEESDVVVGYINEEFTIKYLDLSHRDEGYIELRPANPNFQPIRIDKNDAFEVWGVVVWTIKNWRRY